METDDAALVAELRRLNDEAAMYVSCAQHDDGEWCEFCTATSKLATLAANNSTRLLDLAEEALRLRAVRDAAEHVRLHGERNIAYSMPGLCVALDAAKEKP